MEINTLSTIIVKSLLDTDLYKFTMHQLFFHMFPNAHAKYRFKNRTKEVNLLPYIQFIKNEVEKLNGKGFTKKEIEYLGSIKDVAGIPLFKESYLNFLEDYTLKSRCVTVKEKNGDLDISVKGNILQSMMWEIYLLKIVHGIYSMYSHQVEDEDNHWSNHWSDYLETGKERLRIKINNIKEYLGIDGLEVDDIDADIIDSRKFSFADFGTRRAFMSDWHEWVINETIKHLPSTVFVGTSNVYYAMKYGIKAIGTFGHEYIQAFQGLGVCQLKDSQKVAFQRWADEYRGSLGICLSDTLGLNKFLKDFDLYFAKLFDGCRHDSGDPFTFTDKIIAHYEKLGIDPTTKTIVFSDGLDFDLAIELAEYCRGKIKCSFGIGTNFTNDVGHLPLQIVVKMIECGSAADNMNPVAKVSDNPAKTMCEDDTFLKYILEVIKQ